MPRENQSEPTPEADPIEFRLKTHTDGDFRFGKKVLDAFGFGKKSELKVKVEECVKGKKVRLLLEEK